MTKTRRTSTDASKREAAALLESIHTDSSYKYTPGTFRALATRAGWETVRYWLDPDGLFAPHLLRGSPKARTQYTIDAEFRAPFRPRRSVRHDRRADARASARCAPLG